MIKASSVPSRYQSNRSILDQARLFDTIDVIHRHGDSVELGITGKTTCDGCARS